ncbi:hypothetical protein [Pelomonas cellulosilytica]|uniref:Uncharacterized protein n=1 Tax=Pelomonas cellulosilytica TaxID=2906762 RepID=A0ABS8Y0Y8_9BURK|nr:hypothetical protein [Pelomonas sp. P8]MCE4556566.1 hypothetical protein [Pelomonas sp. P8]
MGIVLDGRRLALLGLLLPYFISGVLKALDFAGPRSRWPGCSVAPPSCV